MSLEVQSLTQSISCPYEPVRAVRMGGGGAPEPQGLQVCANPDSVSVVSSHDDDRCGPISSWTDKIFLNNINFAIAATEV